MRIKLTTMTMTTTTTTSRCSVQQEGDGQQQQQQQQQSRSHRSSRSQQQQLLLTVIVVVVLVVFMQQPQQVFATNANSSLLLSSSSSQSHSSKKIQNQQQKENKNQPLFSNSKTTTSSTNNNTSNNRNENNNHHRQMTEIVYHGMKTPSTTTATTGISTTTSTEAGAGTETETADASSSSSSSSSSSNTASNSHYNNGDSTAAAATGAASQHKISTSSLMSTTSNKNNNNNNDPIVGIEEGNNSNKNNNDNNDNGSGSGNGSDSDNSNYYSGVIDMINEKEKDNSQYNHDDSINRIVGGHLADPGEYPYFVDLDGCGGSLIAPQVILTAAHCGNEGDTRFIGKYAIISAYKRQQTGPGNAADAFPERIVKQKSHPNFNYDFETLRNDFMLLKLQNPVTMANPNNNPNPPILKLSRNADSYEPITDSNLIVMGVGTTSAGGLQASTLLEVTVPVINVDQCDDAYGGIVDIGSDVMFCAGDTETGGIDSCQGDSGGPIIQIIQDERTGKTHHVQVGVVSFGVGCASPEYPGVYAKVGSAYDWIQSVVCDEWNLSADFCTQSRCYDSSTSSSSEEDLLVEFSLHTDNHGSDYSWELVDDMGNVIDNELGGFNKNSPYVFQNCVPKNKCYTLTLMDASGNGFNCLNGSSDAGYKLTVDGNIIDQGQCEDIGDKKILNSFGSCDGVVPPQPSPTQPPQESPTQPPQESPTEPPQDSPTEPPQESPTEPPQESPTQPPQESPTEPPQESPTEPPQESPTQPPQESPTRHPVGGSPSCNGNEFEFMLSFTTDNFGSEISWDLVGSASGTIASGNDFYDNMAYSETICVPKNDDQCFTITIYDSYGDGLSCNGVGCENPNVGYLMTVDGDIIAQGQDDNFGTTLRRSFGDCTNGGSSGCGSDDFEFKISFTTDRYGSEISWNLIDSEQSLIKGGNDFLDETFYTDTVCVPNNKGECYTATIYDEFGDGFSCNGVGCENPNVGYTMTLDGQIIAQGEDEDFGSSVSRTFGDCPRSSVECNPAIDFEFIISFTTDSFGEETSWDLIGDGNGVIGSGNGFDDDTSYSAILCVPRNNGECYTATLHDSFGDGMTCEGSGCDNPDVGYTMTVDGNVIAHGGDHDFGESVSQTFGECAVIDGVGGGYDVGDGDGEDEDEDEDEEEDEDEGTDNHNEDEDEDETGDNHNEDEDEAGDNHNGDGDNGNGTGNHSNLVRGGACPGSHHTFIIWLNIDTFGPEPTWDLVDSSNNVIRAGSHFHSHSYYYNTVCVPKNSGCYTATIYDDSFDDAGEAKYSFTVDGVILKDGDDENFNGETSVSFGNCN